jgi:hypothetical protein
MSELRQGDLKWIERVRATNGGGFPSEHIPHAKLKRLLEIGAIRFKSIGGEQNLGAPDHVRASRAAQSGYVIHGPNAAALFTERTKAPEQKGGL